MSAAARLRSDQHRSSEGLEGRKVPRLQIGQGRARGGIAARFSADDVIGTGLGGEGNGESETSRGSSPMSSPLAAMAAIAAPKSTRKPDPLGVRRAESADGDLRARDKR